MKIGRKKVKYITCCNNVWFIEKASDGVLFGYEGTRAGAIRLQPFFPNVLWHRFDPPIIEFIIEWKEHITTDENGVEVGRCRVTAKVRRFELQVVKYRTTTPKRWQLQWYNQVERIPYTNLAVIMSPEYPMKLVRYKNVYLDKATQT